MRADTNIDGLLEISSVALHQRWDFLGPVSSAIQELNEEFFALVDRALQWQDDGTGRYIRNVLADRLKESSGIPSFLSPSNVAYMRKDPDTIHAIIPFAKVSMDNASEMTYVVILSWEDGRWTYFNTCEFGSGSHELAEFATTVSEADTDYLQRVHALTESLQGSEDGDYWDQFPQPDKPVEKKPKKQADAQAAGDQGSEDDYWNMYDSDENDDDEEQEPERAGVDLEQTSGGSDLAEANVPLLHESLQDMLAGSAKLARGIGMSRDEFLALAAAMF
ncbi:hypothetical protein EC988_002569 [Linderina pennispora]|nr:hypothetical protein EC988_002569 [Linderina pennispora]